ncbi:MAG TPA: AMP-binding protein [Rhodoblastus sp.]|nr:AMP-binding protein [Rhodoblastus sp.]
MLEGCVPWPEDFARRYREKGYWQDRTIPQVIDARAAAAPDRIVIVDGETRMTLQALKAGSENLAAHFHRLGLRAGDRVVFQMPNGAAFFEVFLALLRIGVIPIMALPPHRETELTHFARFGGAKALFTPQQAGAFDFRPMAEAVRAAAPSIEHVFVEGAALDGQISLPALRAQHSAPADRDAVARMALDPSDVALMLLSGGTTALPKLIPRTHNDYVCNFTQSAAIAGFDETAVLLVSLPLAHNYNLGSPGALGALSAGGRLVVAPKTDTATVFALVTREKVTAIPAAVPLIVNWLNDPDIARYDTSSLKLVQNGGARLSPELRDRLRRTFDCQFQEVYGTAEGLLNFTRLDDPDEKILHSSGAPMCADDEIKVIDAEGNELPDGEAGELIVRGPYTIRGYYNAPETNAKAFTPDGFYRMGDIVRKHGRYVVTEGRKNDLINRGGEKISTDEIENLLLRHPAVHGVALVAMPDPVFGEKACAFVTLKDGASLSFEEMKAFLLDQKIAKFKLPERLEILPDFPISPAGKILRRNLREMVEAKLAEEREF